MSKHASAASRRGGFSLPEILVAVAMVGVLSAVTLPAVMSQVNKSEVSRVVQDLQNIGQAAQLYRSDTGEWPATTNDLIVDPTLTGWAGPYLARTSSGNIETGAGGLIQATLGSGTPVGTSVFLRVRVNGLTVADAEAVDLQIDAADAANNWWDTGLVRSVTASSTDPELYYFPVVLK